MAGKTNLDVVTLEKKVDEVKQTLQHLEQYIVRAEESVCVLEKLVEASNQATDREVNILLRAVVRLRGLAPKRWTNQHLIRALLEDKYDVNLHFPKKAAGGPCRPL